MPTSASSASYDAANELLAWNESALSYDANGNMLSDGTHNYAWDARNHLSTIDSGNTGSFVYDPAGRRATKVISGTGTNFLYDQANPVQELSGTTPTANLLTGGLDEYFTRTDSIGAANFLTDALGSTASLTDTTGAIQTQYTFDPYGNTSQSGSNSTNSFAYTGRENDGTGLYYNRARYYSPQLGRFISEDPLRFGSNFFSYASGNPIDFDDPFGLATFYYWSTQFSGPYLQRYGHVSLRLDDGTYISFHPTNWSLSNLNSPIDPSYHEMLAQDDLSEGSPPDVTIPLNNLDEGAIEQWWQKFKKSNPTFQGFGRNCSTIVAMALDAGGGRNHAPTAFHPIVWTPDVALDYAQQLQQAGPGVVNPVQLPPYKIPPFTPFE